MRIAGYEVPDEIRAAYKEGQKHRVDIANLIDPCDDETVSAIAYEFAESGRLRKCGLAAPAQSATCQDLTENLRWALLEGKKCSEYSRFYLRWAFDKTLTLRARAQLVRQSLKVAQGHSQEVFDSVDYIADELLVGIAYQAYPKYNIDPLTYRNPNNDASSVEQFCPGVANIRKHWTYGDRS